MNLFRETFDGLKWRLREKQKKAPLLKKTRWVIHDSKKLHGLVAHLRDSVDALECITSSLVGTQEKQHEPLRQEIYNLSDVASLKPLRDASSSQYSGSVRKDISDAVSQQLSNVVYSCRNYNNCNCNRWLSYSENRAFVASSRL